jgi:hypothetical protein
MTNLDPRIQRISFVQIHAPIFHSKVFLCQPTQKEKEGWKVGSYNNLLLTILTRIKYVSFNIIEKCKDITNVNKKHYNGMGKRVLLILTTWNKVKIQPKTVVSLPGIDIWIPPPGPLNMYRTSWLLALNNSMKENESLPKWDRWARYWK